MVAGDRIELPTQGFSVWKLTFICTDNTVTYGACPESFPISLIVHPTSIYKYFDTERMLSIKSYVDPTKGYHYKIFIL